MIFVEIKAEKYIKSFNKGQAIILSTILPGLGQTKVSKGKPWWITGIGTYGMLTTGLVIHKKYIHSYDSYRKEEDSFKRADLLLLSKQQLQLSRILVASGAVYWATNVIWVSIKPNKFKPLKNTNLSLNKSEGPYPSKTLLSLNITF